MRGHLRIYTPPADARPYFGRVDSLRGLGAFAVAAFHIAGWTWHGQPLVPASVARWIPGHAALMLFFIVSGFVLRIAIEFGPQSVARGGAKFLLGRIFRIFPVVLVSVTVMALIPACVVSHHANPKPTTLAGWVANFLLLDASLNGTLWALQMEILMAPAIVALYFLERRTGPRAILLLALIATPLAFTSRWLIWPPLSTNFFAFALGMTVPTLGRDWAMKHSSRIANLLTFASVSVMLSTAPFIGIYSTFSAVLEAYAAFVLVSLACYRSDLVLTPLLNAKPLTWLGLATGSYYVLHMLTIRPYLMLAEVILPSNLAGPLVLLLWLVTLVPLARLSYQSIEAPGIAAGRRFNRWCGLERAQSVQDITTSMRKAA